VFSKKQFSGPACVLLFRRWVRRGDLWAEVPLSCGGRRPQDCGSEHMESILGVVRNYGAISWGSVGMTSAGGSLCSSSLLCWGEGPLVVVVVHPPVSS
jgi:hypothetical protein